MITPDDDDEWRKFFEGMWLPSLKTVLLVLAALCCFASFAAYGCSFAGAMR